MEVCRKHAKMCTKSSCECCGYRKVKVIVNGKTRKLKVYPNGVLTSIESVVGKVKCLSYVDDENDQVFCYTEKESTMAVFDDGVTCFVIKNSKNPSCTENVMTTSATITTAREAFQCAKSECLANDVLSCASMSTLTFVSTYMRQTCNEGEEKMKKKMKSIKKACTKLTREHLALYGIECKFSCKFKDDDVMIFCSLCSSQIDASNVSDIKKHFLTSEKHSNHIQTLLKTSLADKNTGKDEKLIFSAKRYIFSKGLQNEFSVEESSPNGHGNHLKCLLCAPDFTTEIVRDFESMFRSVEVHVRSKGHKRSRTHRKSKDKNKLECILHKEHQ